jgi:hypothetical protein
MAGATMPACVASVFCCVAFKMNSPEISTTHASVASQLATLAFALICAVALTNRRRSSG